MAFFMHGSFKVILTHSIISIINIPNATQNVAMHANRLVHTVQIAVKSTVPLECGACQWDIVLHYTHQPRLNASLWLTGASTLI